jgi:hypothetical protein
LNKTGKRAAPFDPLTLVEIIPDDLLKSEEKANGSFSDSRKSAKEFAGKSLN